MPAISNKQIQGIAVEEVGFLQLDNGYTVRFDESGALAIKGHGLELFQYPRYLGFYKYETTPAYYQLRDCGWMLTIPEQNVVAFQNFTKLELLKTHEDPDMAKPYEIENPIEFKAAISELKASAELDKKDGYSSVNVDVDLLLALVCSVQKQSK